MLETFSRITLFIAYLLGTEVQSYLEYGLTETCTGLSHRNEFFFTYNSEVAAYMDLQEEKLIFTVTDFLYSIPGFETFFLDGMYPTNDGLTHLCKVAASTVTSINASEPLESPWTSVYPKNEVKLNINNTLICLVSGFFPPPVRVSWTKNNVNVTDESTLSRYYTNKDKTLNVFSRLSFIPEEGDIYSCSVEHKALQQPQTRTWDVEIKNPSIGPSVFCGVGLALGLLGFTTGVFFIAKARK